MTCEFEPLERPQAEPKGRALSSVEIVLRCADGEHRTVLPFPLFRLAGEGFTTIVCDTCRKPFGLNFYAGIPFLDPQEHPPASSLTIQEKEAFLFPQAGQEEGEDQEGRGEPEGVEEDSGRGV